MKRCTICKLDKNLSEFGNNKTKFDGKQSYCKSCSREKDRRCYNTNDIRKQKVLHRRKITRSNNSKIIYDWLINNPCVDCGESDPVVLEFDHRKDKQYNIADLRSYSETVLLQEIKKCEVRCANCHRRRHAKENNWYSNIK